MKNKKYPPCNGDCFNCKRPANMCKGGGNKSPYAKGTHLKKVGSGSNGALGFSKSAGRKLGEKYSGY